MHLRTVTILLGFVLLAGALAYNTRPAYADHITCEASLDSFQEVPPLNTSGAGTASITFSETDNVLSWDIEFTELTGPATGAHFHGPAAEGANAGVQVNIGDVSGLSSPMTGSATLTAAQVSSLLDGTMYVNIHTGANPGGEIRGQVECTEASGGEWETATLAIGDDEFEVQYQITGGTLDDLFGDADSATITAEITAEDDGQLVIQLPREIADAVDEETGDDIDYTVILDDIGDEETPSDDDLGEDVRTLTIDFTVDTTSIDIVGTSVVPEFGAIAAIVLAAAIVGIIVATTKYSKFRFLPKM